MIKLANYPSEKDLKKEIQATVRRIVMIRDGGCILRKHRMCGGELGEAVIQADHLITRANSATYADTRLIVCVCQSCHGWKNWNKEEYDRIVRTVISKERVKLWDKMQKQREMHIPYKADWRMELLALYKELDSYEKDN